jgi:hypothetical protein
MFERTLDSSWDDRSRHGLTTVTSFGLQALVVSVLLLLPLLRPSGLPSFRQLTTPISLGQPSEPPSVARTQVSANHAATITPAEIVFRTPARIPKGISAEANDAAPLVGGGGFAIPELEKAIPMASPIYLRAVRVRFFLRCDR